MEMIIFRNNSADKFTKINYSVITLEILKTYDNIQQVLGLPK